MNPDGLYTIDFSASTTAGYIGDYVGLVVVKRTDPEIAGTVENGQATGQVTDKYIEYNEELALYGWNYGLNEKLYASYVTTQNGSFTCSLTAATTSVTVMVTVSADPAELALTVGKVEARQPSLSLMASTKRQ